MYGPRGAWRSWVHPSARPVACMAARASGLHGSPVPVPSARAVACAAHPCSWSAGTASPAPLADTSLAPGRCMEELRSLAIGTPSSNVCPRRALAHPLISHAGTRIVDFHSHVSCAVVRVVSRTRNVSSRSRQQPSSPRRRSSTRRQLPSTPPEHVRLPRVLITLFCRDLSIINYFVC
jgi:hypothetical protein